MAFSASEAAFEGFRLARRSPMTILIWTILTAVYLGAYFSIFAPMLMAIIGAAQEGREVTESEMMSAMGGSIGLMALFYPLSFIFSAMTLAAVNRAIVRPAESAFGYLRLGMDELRVFIVYFALTILAVIAFMIPYFLVIALVAGVGVALGEQNAGVTVIIGIAAVLALVAAIVFVVVRFSLALPIVVAERRFAFFDSWGMTKGHFWGLLGMFLLAFVMSIVVSLLISIIALPILWFTLGGFDNIAALGSMEFADYAPAAIVALVVYSLLTALQMAILYTPGAAAYLAIKGERGGATPVTGADPAI